MHLAGTVNLASKHVNDEVDNRHNRCFAKDCVSTDHRLCALKMGFVPCTGSARWTCFQGNKLMVNACVPFAESR